MKGNPDLIKTPQKSSRSYCVRARPSVPFSSSRHILAFHMSFQHVENFIPGPTWKLIESAACTFLLSLDFLWPTRYDFKSRGPPPRLSNLQHRDISTSLSRDVPVTMATGPQESRVQSLSADGVFLRLFFFPFSFDVRTNQSARDNTPLRFWQRALQSYDKESLEYPCFLHSIKGRGPLLESSRAAPGSPAPLTHFLRRVNALSPKCRWRCFRLWRW